MEDFRFSVTLPTDDRGMLGHRCPACDEYFKIKPGTGLSVDDCRCPYCEHPDPASEFATREQIKYVESVGLNEYTGECSTRCSAIADASWSAARATRSSSF